MRLRELFRESTATKQLGRTFNHLEDLVFFYGSEGTMEALSHIKDFATQQGAESIRMKWDGNPQIYWGRETKGGPLILAGHNGWARGAKSTSPEEVKDFISNQSGNPKTPEEKAQRDQFAEKFSSLYPLFDQATPKDFVGFVYADGLFLDPPQLDSEGVYTFCPNPKSKTCYHVRKNSELGKKIAKAEVMVVGHAEFDRFGAPDSEQKPKDSFEEFNKTGNLIVLGPIYNKKPISVDTNAVTDVEKYLKQHGKQIDGFLQPQAGLSDLKEILYKFVNQTAKAKQLDNISEQMFFNWLTTSKVSEPKQQKIQTLNTQYNGSLSAIFTLVKMIQDMKDDIIDQIEGEQGDIWDTEGEGRVRYAGSDKRFGNVKLVPRKRWTPGE
jgi:hypothetical protein